MGLAGTRKFDEHIVEEAVMTAFWLNGWRSTSMDMLAQVTGLQKGSLQNAYGNKEGLFLLALARYAGGMRDLIAQEPATAGGLGAARAYLHAILRRLTDPDCPRGCLTTMACMEIEALPPDAAAAVKAQIDGAIAALAGHFEVDARAGRLRCGIEPTSLAVFVVGSARGMAVMSKIGRHNDEIEVYFRLSIAQVEASLSEASP